MPTTLFLAPKLQRKPSKKSMRRSEDISNVNLRRNSAVVDVKRKSVPKSNPFYFYHEENAVQRQRTHSVPEPIGFLSFVDCEDPVEDTTTPSKILLSQYYLLCNVFPAFPKSMLCNLLVREEGNASHVAQGLIHCGWKPDENLISCLNNQSNILLTLNYYWGQLQPEYTQKLKKCPVGTYFSAMISNEEFVIYFVNHKKEIVSKTTNSPFISKSYKRVFSLEYPLNRPSFIPMLNLVPFLRKEVKK